MKRSSGSGLAAAIVAALPLTFAAPAVAHPHVWVTVESTVNYDGGKIASLSHAWTFDDLYTAMAVQGLDANGDGVYSREELQELAKVNIDGLVEYNFFTRANLGAAELKLKDPSDYWLEYKNDVLTLHFTVKLDEPVLADAEGFNFSVFDESFFIAFEFKPDAPVKLSAGAPDGCVASVGIPEKELAQLQALNESFGGTLTSGNQNQGLGAGYAKTVNVGCKRS